jgi:hypothetical protein
MPSTVIVASCTHRSTFHCGNAVAADELEARLRLRDGVVFGGQ